jgi:hypothetical protein
MSARRSSAPDYELQRFVLRGLSAAQRRWEERTGARLVVLPRPPYFRYERALARREAPEGDEGAA